MIAYETTFALTQRKTLKVLLMYFYLFERQIGKDGLEKGKARTLEITLGLLSSLSTICLLDYRRVCLKEK